VYTEKPDELNSGLALGSDIIWAAVALRQGIPLNAYVPFRGQEKKWSAQAQKDYHWILGQCKNIIICSEGGYTPEKMQIRNIKMTDDSNKMAVVWDGQRGGGTWNCLEYILQVKKPHIFIDYKFL